MMCPICFSDLKPLKKFPEWRQCSKCLSLIRTDKILKPGDMDPYKEAYPSALVPEYLYMDRTHYENKVVGAISDIEPEEAISIGGGFPKLETLLNVKRIRVFDGIASIYLENLEAFKQVFPEIEEKKVDWIETVIEPKDIGTKIQGTSRTLWSFVHILEHFFWDDQLEILRNLKRQKGLFLIYQPNPETFDEGNEWGHIEVREHLVMPSRFVLTSILIGMGFEVIRSLTIDSDMLIYGRIH